MAAPEGFEIRPLRQQQEFVQAEDVQMRVWDMDERSTMPQTVMSAIAHRGGVVLGAFEGQTMVGVCLGFIGRTPKGLVHHWSHINGVLSENQGTGLGEQLKWVQADRVLEIGLDLIRWTVDPLEGANATLNFGKLGVTCQTYDRNTYGSMPDGLNASIESDRFIVDWSIDSQRVKSRRKNGKPALSAQAWEAAGAARANPTQVVAEGVRGITDTHLNLESPQVLVEIPASYQAVKLHKLDLAIDWRMRSRELFESYFGQGYVAREFVSERRGDERRNFFLLERT